MDEFSSNVRELTPAEIAALKIWPDVLRLAHLSGVENRVSTANVLVEMSRLAETS